jgi:hypothetical protein
MVGHLASSYSMEDLHSSSFIANLEEDHHSSSSVVNLGEDLHSSSFAAYLDVKDHHSSFSIAYLEEGHPNCCLASYHLHLRPYSSLVASCHLRAKIPVEYS